MTTVVAKSNPHLRSWRQHAVNYIDRSTTGLLELLKLTAQNDNISTATLYTPLQSATYRVTAFIAVTTADGSSSTLPKLTIGWTDPDSGQAQTFDLTATTTGNALTTFKQASMLLDAKKGVDITYATGSYASGTPNVMQYKLVILLEIL